MNNQPGATVNVVINLMRENFLRDGVRAPEDLLVEVICEHWGYGAVMDAAARLWARKDPTGAHTIGPCRCTVQAAIDELGAWNDAIDAERSRCAELENDVTGLREQLYAINDEKAEAVREAKRAQEREQELIVLTAWYHGYHSDASVKALLGYDENEARRRYWEAIAEGALMSPKE